MFGDCDTLVIVSPFESDNLNRGLMTVRASSAHGMGTKKNRGTGHPYRPPLPAHCTLRETATWLVLFVFELLLYLELCPVFLRHFHLVVADRRATDRTTEPLSHAASRPKKSLVVPNYGSLSLHISTATLLMMSAAQDQKEKQNALDKEFLWE